MSANGHPDKHGPTPRTDKLRQSIVSERVHPAWVQHAEQLERENTELLRQMADVMATATVKSASAVSSTRGSEIDADAVLHAHTEICELFARNSGRYDPSPEEVDAVQDGLTEILGRVVATSTPSATPAKTCRMQDGPPIPWALAEAIWQGYAQCGGSDQPLEVVDRRGGFGWDEVAHIWKRREAREAIEAALRRADDTGQKP